MADVFPFYLTWQEWSNLGDLLQGIGSLATVFALLAAAGWWWHQKSSLARISDHGAAQVLGHDPDGTPVLDVTISLENNGIVPFCVVGAWARVKSFDLQSVKSGTPENFAKDLPEEEFFKILDAEFLITQNSKTKIQFFCRPPDPLSHVMIEWVLQVEKGKLPNKKGILRKFIPSVSKEKTPQGATVLEVIKGLKGTVSSDILILDLKA